MKRKLILLIFLIPTLIIAFGSSGFSQTSPSPTVNKSETVSFLIEQNENARALIAAADARIKDLTTEISAERDALISITKSYDLALKEIELHKSSNASLAAAVAINEQTINLLQTENLKQRTQAKNADKAKYKAYAVAIGVIALKFLIP